MLIINFKNYGEVLGDGALRLARAAESATRDLEVELILAPPVPNLSSIAAAVAVPVFSQGVANQSEGRSTGHVIPEAVRAAGCAGSLINHSESRLPLEALRQLLPRMKGLGLRSCVCGEDAGQVAGFAPLGSEYLAVEPPELIGGGIAVSKARPELLGETSAAARGAGYTGRLLCGAGIVSGEDARAAMELGMDGILVASSVVRSADWRSKVRELASALL
ncbi:MAG: triose-phosphate isomerase [Nitrososphaerales archaeon]